MDEYVWHYIPSGEFTISFAYRVIWEDQEKEKRQPAASTSEGKNDRIWRHVGSIDARLCIKLMLWRFL